MFPNFTIIKESEFGRVGRIETAHGFIETPAFIFCATKGAVKACSPEILRRNKTQVILSNTYHLSLFPGTKVINSLGGLQKMTGWNGPMMTDSGGYQVFSLGYGSVSQELKGVRNNKCSLVRVCEDGVEFKSYRDGSKVFLSPEKSIQAQIDMGADIIFAFDECTAFHISKEKTQLSMERSIRWGIRCQEYFSLHKKEHQGLYGIVQGGVYDDLRKKSINHINESKYFGIGIGGSLGKTNQDMKNVLSVVNKYADKTRPKHLLGIGTIDSMIMAVPYGIDTFDCVYPTRLARHGGALVKFYEGRRYLNLNNSKFYHDDLPIDKNCKCNTCSTFSRSYLHFLLKNNEILGLMGLTEHNIFFMNNIVGEIRLALIKESWPSFLEDWTTS